ncbi:GPI anchored endo-1,3(4)-beta-glucanase [Cordyceps militaris CM01]|uniref:GPI anchored endo-1,3(4)-beta-glucanase n=1 Tax=Cordyceps militaris (strain CM01) TaxID=983644 RepID=G3J8H4_CORMM|nr:GPI anchored endo-1,3(4)-beta-glucanase [Cordyceps militaris CM01]EGX94761.1 GPI anchored endo-1,3(4)-beta-glucanase [Cordyceps militaris CM01]
MAYSLATSYTGEALINGFNWVDTRDYSNGYVRYQSQANAASQGLFAVDPQTGVVRIGVDHTNTYDVTAGRPSIRIESKTAFNQGLFIGDFSHMPPSQCGVWPAFWAYGPNWPASGEIDIIEGANTAHRNIISAHTTSGCQLGADVLAMASGVAQDTNCDVGTQNIGCGYVPPAADTSSYGDTFNAVGGGVYAMQWDDDFIKVWHFDRAAAPADIAAKRPDPAGWGKPQAVYGGQSCDVQSHFRDMSIVLNINFCGDYGNAVWASDGCTALAPTCSEWVAKNPAAFANAYWDVNYIDAYVQGVANTTTSSSISSTHTTSSQSQTTSTSPIVSLTTTSSQSQTTSNSPVVSLNTTPGSTSSQNGTFTRFSVASNSSMPNPTNPSSSSSFPSSSSSLSSPSTASSPFNSSTTTTSLGSITALTTAERAGPIPTASLPAPGSNPRANPANLNDFSYLGCFGSSSDFKSFTKVADRADMDLDRCTELCNGKKYAGVFDTSCYCAEELDADTRVSADACDAACPGNARQFCGGRIKGRGNSTDDGIGATANVTLPNSSSFVSGGPVPLRTDSTYPGNPVGGSKFNATTSGQALPSGTGIPLVTGTLTAPWTINLVATFNSTGSGALPGSSGISASDSSISTSTTQGSSSASATTTLDVVATFNSTSPSNSETTSADTPVVTIPVYPIPKADNATASSSSSSSAAATSGSAPVASGSAPAPFSNSTLTGRRLLGARSLRMMKSVRPSTIDRRAAADFLLTVYAAVAKEDPPKQPPGMGIHTSNAPSAPNFQAKQSSVVGTTNPSTITATSTTTTVVTTIHYLTVYPSKPSEVVTETFVTTIVKAHCGCTETPPPVMTVPMETKVISCSACGRKGENTVTITVPCSVDVATPTATPSGSLPPSNDNKLPPAPGGKVPSAPADKAPPAFGGNAPPSPGNNAQPAPSANVLPAPSKYVKPAPSEEVIPAPSANVAPPPSSSKPPVSGGSASPAPSGKLPPAPPSTVPVVAGASGFKVTSLLLTTMLAMVLLL